MDAHAQEIIDALKARIKKYEAILEEVLAKPKLSGMVVAGPHNQIYRVKSSTSELFIVPNPNMPCEYKIGDSVLCTENVILEKMPDVLEIKKQKFNFVHLKWDQIGGMKSQINEIRKSVEQPLNNAKLYEEYGGKALKGLLLYGPPGNGKTLIAKAIASTILEGMKDPDESSFVYVKGPELLSMYVGATEQAIKNIFAQCRHHKVRTGYRSVIFIDEAESLLPERGSGISSDVERTIVPMFLSEMDGFDGDTAPFVILATNKPNHIDKAILREGRIDLKIQVGRPTEADAIEIFDIYLKKTRIAEDNIAPRAAALLFDKLGPNKMSGSLIATTVSLAIENVISRKLDSVKNQTNFKDGVLMSDIIHSFNKITNNEYMETARETH